MSLPLLPSLPPSLPAIFARTARKTRGREEDGRRTTRDAGRDAEKRTSMLVNYAAAPAAGRRFYERREVG